MWPGLVACIPGNMSSMEQVNINARRLWCPRHLEALRPGGIEAIGRATWDLVTAVIFDVLLFDPPSLEDALLELCPLCCHVGDDHMRDIYCNSGGFN